MLEEAVEADEVDKEVKEFREEIPFNLASSTIWSQTPCCQVAGSKEVL